MNESQFIQNLVQASDELKPCCLCHRHPYLSYQKIRGYEPAVDIVVEHNPYCWIHPEFHIKESDTVYRSPEEAIKNVIIQWNNYMTIE